MVQILIVAAVALLYLVGVFAGIRFGQGALTIAIPACLPWR